MIEFVDASEADRREMRAVNDVMRELMAAGPSMIELGAAETRRARVEGLSWMGPLVHDERAVTRRIDTEQGPLVVRVITPATGEPGGVYLHIHGGGWVLGGADHQDALLVAIADGAGLVVVSVEYRLAPEHPFPASPDDCEAAAVWLIEHAMAEFGSDRLLIGGESAGAHLAALTLLRLRSRFGSVAPFVAANLVYGAFDLTWTPSTRIWGSEVLVLSLDYMEWFGSQFLPNATDEERRDPRISPLYADLTGLVAALFTVGAADPLIDDSLFMGARWRAAGNPAEVVVFPDAPHGFVALPTAIARAGLARQVRFLAQHAAAVRP